MLIPHDKQAPDPSILSLNEMEVDIRIDNNDARVWIRQIFANHTERIEEGNYVFALPSGTQVSDFAVWDGPTRIPAVILNASARSALYQPNSRARRSIRVCCNRENRTPKMMRAA